MYPPGELDPALPVLGPQGPLFVVQHTPGEIILEPDAVDEGDTLM